MPLNKRLLAVALATVTAAHLESKGKTMTDTKHTAAQPLDLDSLTRYTVRTSTMGAPAWMEATWDGEYVKFADVAALIAQARTARLDQQKASDTFAHLLSIQRAEAESGDPYMTGLYNGMSMICANIDGDLNWEPMRAVKSAARLDTTASAPCNEACEEFGMNEYCTCRAAHPVQAGEAVDRIMAIAHRWAQAAYAKALNKPGEDIDSIKHELRATLAPVAAPSGYVMVPINPTPEMIEAGNNVEDLYRRGTPETWGRVYRAMVKAAPVAAQQAAAQQDAVECISALRAEPAVIDDSDARDAAYYRLLRDAKKIPGFVWAALEAGEGVNEAMDMFVAITTPIPFCEPCKAGRFNECEEIFPCTLPTSGTKNAAGE